MNQERMLQDKQIKDATLTRINYFGKQTKKPKLTRNKPHEAQRNTTE